MDPNMESVNSVEQEDESTIYSGTFECCCRDGARSSSYGQGVDNDVLHQVRPDRTTEENQRDTVSKWPLAMITLAVTFAVGANSCHGVMISQFVYSSFDREILGNQSIDSTRHPCGNRSSNDSELDHKVKEIQEKSSHLLLFLNITSYSLGVISNVLLGTYSIILDRRTQILIPTLGFTVRCTVLLVIAYWRLDVHWLYLGYACDGMFGTFAGVYLGILLYTTDVTPRSGKRTIGIAILEGLKGLMGGCTKLMMGFLLDGNDFVLPAMITLGFLLIALMIVCALPNHKPKMNVGSDGNHALSFKKAFLIMTSPFDTKIKEVRRMLLLIMFSFFSVIIVMRGTDKITTLFFMNLPFCWSSVMIGWFDFVHAISYHLFIIIGVPLLYRCLPGITLGIGGLFFIMATFLLYCFAHTDVQAFMGAVLTLGRGFPIPIMRGETSQLLKPEVQGPLFACFSVLESVCFFIAPVLFINLYRASLNIYRGLVFAFAAAMLIPPFLAMIVHQKMSARYERNKHIEIAQQESDDQVQHEEAQT